MTARANGDNGSSGLRSWKHKNRLCVFNYNHVSFSDSQKEVQNALALMIETQYFYHSLCGLSLVATLSLYLVQK